MDGTMIKVCVCNVDDDDFSPRQLKACLLNLFLHKGEHFQFQRILIKHWRTNEQITIKKTASGKVKVIKLLCNAFEIKCPHFHFLD